MGMRRPVAEWGLRGSLALTAIAFGYVSVSHTVAQSIRRADPARAYRLAPYDGRFMGAVAQQLSGDGIKDARQAAKVEMLAERSLKQDPTAVSAVVSLGLVQLQKGDQAAADRLLKYAQYLSRRDLPTQLWAIEAAVAAGDISRALKHYDIALRTSNKAPELLFPILASAISQSDVRSELAAVLSKKPQWTAAFIGYVAGSNADPVATSSLFINLRRNGLSISSDATAALINRMIANNAVGTAWDFYTQIRNVKNRKALRDPNFTHDITTPSVFDWNPVNDDVITTSITDSGENRGFHFTAYASGNSIALRQLQMLPAGYYRIEGKIRDVVQIGASSPYWLLSCDNSQEIARIPVRPSDKNDGRFFGEFHVPGNCLTQTLALVVKYSDSTEQVTGTIESVNIISQR